MSERVDRKLVEVAVAAYGYRHEAEFAAGFLEDAGIPFRLQLDDPVLGLVVSGSATLWVLGMHADAAREVLEIDPRGRPEPSPMLDASSVRRPTPRPVSPSREGSAEAGLVVRLAARERLLALLGGAGIAALGWTAVGVGGAVTLQALVGAVTVCLVLAAVFGRAPRFLRDVLAAISGGPP